MGLLGKYWLGTERRREQRGHAKLCPPEQGTGTRPGFSEVFLDFVLLMCFLSGFNIPMVFAAQKGRVTSG